MERFTQWLRKPLNILPSSNSRCFSPPTPSHSYWSACYLIHIVVLCMRDHAGFFPFRWLLTKAVNCCSKNVRFSPWKGMFSTLFTTYIDVVAYRKVQRLKDAQWVPVLCAILQHNWLCYIATSARWGVTYIFTHIPCEVRSIFLFFKFEIKLS